MTNFKFQITNKILSPILILLTLYFLYIGNIKPWLASQAFIKREAAKALNYNTFINHEARKYLAQTAINSNNSDLVLFSLKEMEKNIKERPRDVKSYILLSYLYYRVNSEKINAIINTAQELAPNREDVKKLDQMRR